MQVAGENPQQYSIALVFYIKRLYKPEWGENWRKPNSVSITVNGGAGT